WAGPGRPGSVDGGRLAAEVDGTEALLVAPQVLLHGEQKALGVLGGGDHPRAHLRPRLLRLDENEVEEEFGGAVGDRRHVDVDALGDVVVDLDLEPVGPGLHLFAHDRTPTPSEGFRRVASLAERTKAHAVHGSGERQGVEMGRVAGRRPPLAWFFRFALGSALSGWRPPRGGLRRARAGASRARPGRRSPRRSAGARLARGGERGAAGDAG